MGDARERHILLLPNMTFTESGQRLASTRIRGYGGEHPHGDRWRTKYPLQNTWRALRGGVRGCAARWHRAKRGARFIKRTQSTANKWEGFGFIIPPRFTFVPRGVVTAPNLAGTVQKAKPHNTWQCSGPLASFKNYLKDRMVKLSLGWLPCAKPHGTCPKTLRLSHH